MNFNDYQKLGFTVLQNGLIAYYPKLQLSDAELIVVIQLEAFLQRGNKFPSNEEISSNTNLAVGDVAGLIQKLIDQNYLSIDQITDSQGRIGNQYNLTGLYEKLDEYLKENVILDNPKGKNSENFDEFDKLDNNPLNQLSRKFEIEFGRYLSPIEREEIAAWLNLDHYQPEIIELALREAVLSQAYSLKYVDRILLNWQRHNLKTPAEIKQFLQRNR
ncbi:DnaD domain protein [Lactobacillus agrestimuris]|uniref:DnaD domain protein n=1 Tax=Lactobacillus agrestimuris TaxID=2941328 RepID=UPI0019C20ECC|nr:DnaD domain protein [Lactobacillus agrestimuris]MBD5431657.1 DnaD domain protein [Lactobacillus sp.]